MIDIFSRVHYLILLVVILIIPYSLFNHKLSEPEYIWLLSSFPNIFSPMVLGAFLFVISVLAVSINLVFSHHFFRIAAFLSILMLFSFKFSFGKIDHVYHIWIISSFCLIFIKDGSHLQHPKNRIVIRIVQSCLLMQYFSSGIWKLLSNKEIFSLDGITATSLNHIAYSVAESNWPINFIRYLLIYDIPWLGGLGLLMVLFFQILCGVCGLIQRGYILCGTMAVIFHCMTGFALGTWYWGTAIASIFFLVVVEKLILDYGHVKLNPK